MNISCHVAAYESLYESVCVCLEDIFEK